MPTLDLIMRSESFAPRTFDADSLTFEAVITTGAPVNRRDARGGFVERLDTFAVDPASLAGLPVLDGHRSGAARDVVGVILSARRDGRALLAKIRLSQADDVRSTAQKVIEGILRGVSIGYAVERWEESGDSGMRTRTAVKWRIKEVSLVAVPADPESQVRSDESMTTETTAPEPEATVETRAAIRGIARRAGLDSEWADAQIDAGADVTAARAAAFDAMVTRTAQPIRTASVGASSEDPAVLHSRQVEALACRMSGGTPSDAARPFMGWGLTDYARDAMTRSGEAGVATMGREELLTRAMHTVSDFPELLTGAGNRVLAAAYQTAASPLKMLARQRTAPDFRPLSILRVGEFGKLRKVAEHGEITALSGAEAVEGYSIDTFGGIFALTRKAIVNDDLGALAQWSAHMGRAAAETEADQLVALLTANGGTGPVMADGRPLFHADHGNIALASEALGIALSTARVAMRLQKGLDGTTPINVTARYLLVAPAMETTAEQVLATLYPTKVDDQNPFAGKLTLLVEPRLTGSTWYLFADPAAAPVLEYAYLSSAQGPQMASRDGWEVLGREFRVTLDFGCGVTDHRGAYVHPA
jgi:HK97 family phage prohead protease